MLHVNVAHKQKMYENKDEKQHFKSYLPADLSNYIQHNRLSLQSFNCFRHIETV